MRRLRRPAYDKDRGLLQRTSSHASDVVGNIKDAHVVDLIHERLSMQPVLCESEMDRCLEILQTLVNRKRIDEKCNPNSHLVIK